MPQYSSALRVSINTASCSSCELPMQGRQRSRVLESFAATQMTRRSWGIVPFFEFFWLLARGFLFVEKPTVQVLLHFLVECRGSYWCCWNQFADQSLNLFYFTLNIVTWALLKGCSSDVGLVWFVIYMIWVLAGKRLEFWV